MTTQAHKLTITGRNPSAMSRIASFDDFAWEHDGHIDASQILDNPNISLYCVDDERNWAIFVVLPDGVDLSNVPFVYQAQFEQAQHLIAVPYAEFIQLADAIDVKFDQLSLVHNIGRCGSTLLSRALSRIEAVMALSEPDIFAHTITLRHRPRPQQIELLQASYKMLFRPVIAGKHSHNVVKLRNQCVDVMDVYVEAFPYANHVFMYRNAIDWLASLYRLMSKSGSIQNRYTRIEAIQQQTNYLNCDLDELVPYFHTAISDYTRMGLLAMSWVIMMAKAQQIISNTSDFQPLVLRYEDLKASSEAVMAQVLTHLDLPKEALRTSLVAFESDSQAGTTLARDNQSGNIVSLPDDEMNHITEIFNKQSVINRPDIVLPNTLKIQ